jgi:glycosyltransferase involved in cell wall biosynthesis
VWTRSTRLASFTRWHAKGLSAEKARHNQNAAVSSPLRIAVIEPTPMGGLLHYATQMADGLASVGADTTLIVARDNELAERRGPARRRAVLPPDARPAPPNPTRAQVFKRRAGTALRLVATWWQIAREVRSGAYDVVLLEGSFDRTLDAAAAMILLSVKGRAPIAHVCHNVRPFNRWGGDNLYIEGGATIALLRRLYPRFDLVFVHGERSREDFERSWPPTRLMVIPHGDEGLFGDPPPPGSEPRILFFGTWRKMKGLGVLMEAFDRLITRRPEVRLTIAGQPVPEEGESAVVRAWAAERRDVVEIVDEYVPIEAVPDLFGRARVVVLPYLTVYQSGVVHLAMTMQRPVVATNVGELASVVADGVTGFVVPSGDPVALADALERVLADPELARRMGERGRERVKQAASWDQIADRVQAGLRSVVADGGAAAP